MTLISIIIPFYNEEENIPQLILGLNDYFFIEKEINAEIILVDDGSDDKSVEILKRQLVLGYNIKLIRLSQNFGSHAALRAGLLHTTGNFAMFLPADLQDPLFLVRKMYDKVKEGYEIVLAHRLSVSVSFYEKVFSKLYAFLMKKFVSKNFPDNGYDIAFFSRKVINILNQNIEANSSLMLQILTMGFPQGQIGYEKEARNAGKSKWTLSKKIKLLVDSFVAFSYTPIRLVTYVGILFFITGIGWTFYITLRKILVDDLVLGWAMLTSILLLGFGLTNISLGIIAEYLWRTLDASRKRPVFIIDEIVELNP
jgi:glycosyltransferase involved in cell wall biosynthesis